jgi:hypothetical protein
VKTQTRPWKWAHCRGIWNFCLWFEPGVWVLTVSLEARVAKPLGFLLAVAIGPLGFTVECWPRGLS